MSDLVDYSSSDEDEGKDEGEVGHRAASTAGQSTMMAAASPRPSTQPAAALPPLPRAFHDIYSTNVRKSTADCPSLHHGRTRAIPHVAGQWPSHIYIEWIPTSSEHASLAALLTAVNVGLSGTAAVHSLLTSDLGAPLPLHISLSRPFVLQTAEKSYFLSRLVASVSAARVTPFHVEFCSLDWFRSPDSQRAFLVLRVAVMDGKASLNRPLVSLLMRCNDEVAAVGQPILYRTNERKPDSQGVATSFHVSIAWTLAENINTWTASTEQPYTAWRRDGKPLNICIDTVKAKIGNVITDIPLASSERRAIRARTAAGGRGVCNKLLGL